MKEYYFRSDSDGGLYDTRVKNWHELPALRPVYRQHFRSIESIAQLKACLRAGPYAWPGGYPMYFITESGDELSFESVRECFREVCRDSSWDSAWNIVALDINWENPQMYCAHSNKLIESAYGEESVA